MKVFLWPKLKKDIFYDFLIVVDMFSILAQMISIRLHWQVLVLPYAKDIICKRENLSLHIVQKLITQKLQSFFQIYWTIMKRFAKAGLARMNTKAFMKNAKK